VRREKQRLYRIIDRVHFFFLFFFLRQPHERLIDAARTARPQSAGKVKDEEDQRLIDAVPRSGMPRRAMDAYPINNYHRASVIVDPIQPSVNGNIPRERSR